MQVPAASQPAAGASKREPPEQLLTAVTAGNCRLLALGGALAGACRDWMQALGPRNGSERELTGTLRRSVALVICLANQVVLDGFYFCHGGHWLLNQGLLFVV